MVDACEWASINHADLTRVFRKGIADEQLAKLEEERGRKHDRQSEDPDVGGAPKRMRSESSASSASVSTISTNMTRSPSPRSTSRNPTGDRTYYASRSHSPPVRDAGRPKPRKRSPSPPTRVQPNDSEKKRRRESFTSESHSSEYEKHNRASRERTSSRSARRKFRDVSPPVRGRRTESRRSREDRRRSTSHDRRYEDDWERPSHRNDGPPPDDNTRNYRNPPRERSLSPFSKRLALTQAMNSR